MLMLYRKINNSDIWHWCRNCHSWPSTAYEETMSEGRPKTGKLCPECERLEKVGGCRHYR